jgi:enterochelin esterase-like enzyme
VENLPRFSTRPLQAGSHIFDSTQIVTGSVFFQADSAIVKNHSSIRADSAGIREGPWPRVKQNHEVLQKKGINNIYFESPGTVHEWLTWRRSLHAFAPLLFS